MSDIEKLAERVEAATGATDELDLAIATWCYENKGVAGVIYDPALWVIRNGGFVDSIDDALSLVPDKWKLRQIHFNAPCADDRKWNVQLRGGREGEDCFTAFAATPALALAAAALRARLTVAP